MTLSLKHRKNNKTILMFRYLLGIIECRICEIQLMIHNYFFMHRKFIILENVKKKNKITESKIIHLNLEIKA